jgi:hypothetical protein
MVMSQIVETCAKPRFLRRPISIRRILSRLQQHSLPATAGDTMQGVNGGAAFKFNEGGCAMNTSDENFWPALPLEEWEDTYHTLHMWT